MDAIEGLARDLTILIIAHRLTTVRHCDLIVELEDGRVVAQGPQEEGRHPEHGRRSYRCGPDRSSRKRSAGGTGVTHRGRVGARRSGVRRCYQWIPDGDGYLLKNVDAYRARNIQGRIEKGKPKGY